MASTFDGSAVTTLSAAAVVVGSVSRHLPASLPYRGAIHGTPGEVLTVAEATQMATGPAGDPGAADLPTQAYVEAQVALYTKPPLSQAGSQLQTTTQVSNALAGYPTVAQLNAQASKYYATSALGANSGLATMATTAVVTAAQVNAANATDRVMRTATLAAHGKINFSGTVTVDQTNVQQILLATIDVEDPGYPWIPMPFATVSGHAVPPPSSQTPLVDPAQLVDCTALITVVDASGANTNAYGIGIANGTWWDTETQVLPDCAATSQQATVAPIQPVISGGLTLAMYGNRYLGAGSYVFNSSGLDFYVDIAPAYGTSS